jgi:chemotaxis protein MotB
MADHGGGLTLIKRKKVIAGGGHHGGAWKVAYADFVTAMMAFFLLMWLLNATTEKQRKGIADYFSPTIPISKVSNGGNGSLNGETMFAEDSKAMNGTGATNERPSQENQARGMSGTATSPVQESARGSDDELARIESLLNGDSGESFVDDELLQHVSTRVTDEGLIIELFDLEDSPLFVGNTDQPGEKLTALTGMIAEVAATATNAVAVTGHTSAVPLVLKINPNWELSAARAQRVRTLLMGFGLADSRFERVTGQADRNLADANPMAARNRRVEITLLRADRA